MEGLTRSDHLFKRIVSSSKREMLVLRYGLKTVLVFLGAISLWMGTKSLSLPDVYRKDFIQEYLLAKAMLAGAPPYSSLHELAVRFMGQLPYPVFRHPTPHPPPVALICMPLGWLTYQQAAAVWFAFEIACILVSAHIILRCLDRRPTLGAVLTVSLVALAWSPYGVELAIGQLMTLNLVLLAGAWHMLRSGRQVRGGILLGGAVAIKLIAWPIVVFLALRKEWRAALAAGAVLAAANITAAFWMGYQAAADYYLKVGTQVFSLYRTQVANFSLWTIGWRLFKGTDSPALSGGVNAYPLINAPYLAAYLAVVPPLILLVAGLYLAFKASSFDTSFSLIICVCILVAPIAWSHYLILATIPLAIVARRLASGGFQGKETNVAVIAGLLLLIPRPTLVNFVLMFADRNMAMVGDPTVPFAATMFSLIPTMAVLVLLWLVIRTDQPAYRAHT